VLFASALAAVATYLLLNILSVAFWIQLAVGTMFFLVVIWLAAPLVGAVTQTDIDNLRSMFSTLGIASKLLEIPLKFAENL